MRRAGVPSAASPVARCGQPHLGRAAPRRGAGPPRGRSSLAGRALDHEPPVERLDAGRRGPLSPLPRDGSAPPTPSSTTSTIACPSSHVTRTRTYEACRVLRHVRQRLGDDVERPPASTCFGSRPGGQRLDLDRQRRPLGQRLERGGEPAVAEHRGMEAAGELAQLLERERQLGGGRAEAARRRLRVAAEPRLREPERERERDEPLLRAVVEVPLEAPPLGGLGLDDPRPRAPDLLLLALLLGHVDAADEVRVAPVQPGRAAAPTTRR